MVIINEISTNYFELNGVKHPKIFICLTTDEDELAVYNIYDTTQQLLPTTKYSDIELNGIIYTSINDLITNLIDVIFSRSITTEIPFYEPYLGNPGFDNYVLKSDTNGNRYWGPSEGGIGEESDPIFLASPASAITLEDLGNYDTAFAWGNHSEFGYITGITVSDDNTNTNTHQIATIEGTIIKETITKLNTPILSGNLLSLTYINENGVEQSVSVDLSSIVTNESGISNATYDAATNVITLDEVDGDSYTIDLSEFSIIPNTDASGITTITQENLIKLIVSKVGQSGQFGDLLNIPTTISGYGITDAYRISEINNFFGGTTTISGYNKVDWDAAFSWGDHAGLYDKYGGWNVQVNGLQKSFLGPNSALNYEAGNNVLITFSTPNKLLFSATNNYITSLSGDGNSLLTIGRNGLSNLTLDLSHNHNGVYEATFTKNTAFNKDFGTAAGTVAQGNDSRINNGQTAFTWGDHAEEGYLKQNDLPPEINQDNRVRVIQISEDDLPNNYNKADVVSYLNTNGFTISETEIITIEVNDGLVTVTAQVNIITPTEGQEINGDVNITFELLNVDTVSIITPTEGEEISGDVSIEFELT